MVSIPVKWLEIKDDGTAVARIKQKSGGALPITVGLDQLHTQYPRMKHITSIQVLVGLLKRKGGMITIENIKMGNKREKRLENRREEKRWSE